MIPQVRWQVLAVCGAVVAFCFGVFVVRSLRKAETAESSVPDVQRTPQADADTRERAVTRRSSELKETLREGGETQGQPPNGDVITTDKSGMGHGQASAATEAMSEGQLLETLKSTNKTDKIAAAIAITRRPTPNLVAGLMQETSICSDGYTRAALLSAIASMNSEQSIPELVKPLGLKKDEDIQQAAKTSLLRSSSPAVVDALIGRGEAAATDQYLCRDMGRILADVRNSAAVPNLISGLASTNPPLIAGCSVALASIGEAQGLQALFGQLDGTGELRNSILRDAIAQARSPNTLPVLTSVLTGQAGGSSSNARLAALRALGNFSPEQRSAVLNQYLMVESDPQLQAEARKLLNN